MKLSFAGLTGLCLVALAFTCSAKAQNASQAAEYAKLPDKYKTIYRDGLYASCIVKLVDLLAKNDDFGRARSLKENCACKVNRTIQGLMIEDCPKIKTVSGEQLRKYFD